MKKTALILFALAFAGTAAYAEKIDGTVTSVDATGRRVVLTRNDNGQTMELSVRDAGMLKSVKNGTQISVDAIEETGGGFRTDTITPSSSVQATTFGTGTSTQGTTAVTSGGSRHTIGEGNTVNTTPMDSSNAALDAVNSSSGFSGLAGASGSMERSREISNSLDETHARASDTSTGGSSSSAATTAG
jgi:hypothetical protein